MKMKLANYFTMLATLAMLTKQGAADGNWIQISPDIEFQSRMDPAKNNMQMIRAKNSAIDRMLKQQGYTSFSTSPYTIGMEDMNGGWDADVQVAWHLLGFYIDCNSNNDEADDHHRRALQEGDDPHDEDHKDEHEEDHKDDHHDENEAVNTCRRKTMYAVVSLLIDRLGMFSFKNVDLKCAVIFYQLTKYVDPNYQGGGIGEYEYYDRNYGDYVCYSGNCRAKMDCHSSYSETWQLLGLFKIDKVSQGDGWMEQLFKHAGVCYWGSDNYSFMSGMREKFPDGCKKTQYKANGNYLYMDIKPEENAHIDLALYTDSICSKLYTGDASKFDVYGLAGTSYYDVISFNKLLNGYKICQPCVAYNLSSDGYSCSDDAGYTNCNQCMKFAIKAQSSAATPQDIMLAYRQSSMLPIANLTTEVDITNMKQLESDIVYDAVYAFPLYLQASLIFFLGCLTFYFVPTKSSSTVSVMNHKRSLLDDESTATADRSESDGSFSPPNSPSGLIVNCDPLRPKNMVRCSAQLSNANEKDSDLSESDGQGPYDSPFDYNSDLGRSEAYISESDASTSGSERGRNRRDLLNSRFT